MTPKIAVRALHHEYVNRFTRERVVALEGVDLEVAEGEFLATMVKEHEKAIEMVRRDRMAAEGDLRKMLDDLLPQLQKHRDRAQQLRDSIKGTKTSKAPIR